jgi:hypothetical protein
VSHGDGSPPGDRVAQALGFPEPNAQLIATSAERIESLSMTALLIATLGRAPTKYLRRIASSAITDLAHRLSIERANPENC